MISIKMLQNAKGANDGAIVRSYTTDGGDNGDGVYNVSDDLGQAFVDGGEAEVFDGAPIERKAKSEKVIGLPPLGK